MFPRDWMQFAVYVMILMALTPVLGRFIFKIFKGERTISHLRLVGASRLSHCRNRPQSSNELAGLLSSTSLINALGILAVFMFQVLQAYLPLNPQHLPNVGWDSAINTAVSFVTNTNWQGYSGETTMSYLTQMAALTVQNYMSAAVGLAVAIALARGIAGSGGGTIGNFWADLSAEPFTCSFPSAFSIRFS